MEDPAFPASVKKVLSVLFIITGVAIYLFWGLYFGAWNPFDVDYIGVYSLMAVLIGLGAMGLVILRLEEEEEQD